jgi:hypothetical protein
MMSDFELALWSLSPEEREMLKRYALYYWHEYGKDQAQPKRAESSTKKGLEDDSFYNPLLRIERDVIFSKRM